MTVSTKQRNTRIAKLRAYEIENTLEVGLLGGRPNLVELFSQAVSNLTINDRRLPLNPEEENGDEYVLSRFERGSVAFWGTLTRLKNAGAVKILTEEELHQAEIRMPENPSDNLACIEHFHFAFDNKFLVTTLRGNASLSPLEKYLSHFSEVGNVSLRSKMRRLSVEDLAGISEIQFSPKKNCSKELQKELNLIPGTFLKNFFLKEKDVNELKREVAEITSAKVVLSFKKPSNMTDWEYEQSIASILGNIEALENITFRHKSRGIIESKEFLEMKEVSVDATPLGNFNEEMIFRRLVGFLGELRL